MKLQRVHTLLTVTILLCSCQFPGDLPKSSVNCDKVLLQELSKFDFSIASVDELVVRTHKVFSVPESEIRVSATVDGNAHYIYWQSQKLKYSLEPHTDGRMRLMIDMRHLDAPPMVSHVLGCMGSPDYYSFKYVMGAYVLELLYVEEGMVFSAERYQANLPKDMRSTSIADVFVVKGGDLDQVLRNSFYSAEAGLRSKSSLRPWPGHITKIELMGA